MGRISIEQQQRHTPKSTIINKEPIDYPQRGRCEAGTQANTKSAGNVQINQCQLFKSPVSTLNYHP